MSGLRLRALLGRWGPPLVVVLASIAVHARELVGEKLYYRDVHQLLVPVKAFVAERLRAGELPEWWPYDGAGSPLLAQPLFGVFHPTELLYLALPFWKAFALTNLLATLFAGLGTYLLARALGASRIGSMLSGGAFVSSGLLVSMTEFAFAKLAAAAMPWYAWSLLVAARRGGAWMVLPALVLATALTAGEPQFALFAAVFGAAVLLASRPPSRRLLLLPLLSPIIAALLAAVQLVPALLLAPHTERAAEMTVRERWVLGGSELAAWIVPIDLGPAALYRSLFLGLPVVALAFASLAVVRRRRIVAVLWALAIVALVTSAGARGGLDPLWRAIVPMWSAFRYPLKSVVVAVLAMCLLAGLGLQPLAHRLRRRRALGWAAGAALSSLALASLAFAPHLEAVASLALSALLFVAAGRSQALRAVASVAVIAFTLAGTLPTLRYTDGSLYEKPAMASVLEKAGVGLEGAYFERSNSAASDPERWAALQAAAAGGGATAFNGLFGLPSLSPALPGASRRLRALMEHPDAMSARLDGVFGVAVMVLTPEQVTPRLAEQVVGREPEFGWTAVRLRHFLPRAYAASRTVVATSPEDAVSRVLDPSFAPGREVVLDEAPPTSEAEAPDEPAREARVTARTNTSVTVHADLPWSGVVVLNEAWFPGWRAFVDGAETPVFPANAAMRAVRVGAGSHEIVFRYRTPGLTAGLAVSLATLTAAAVAAMLLARRARRGRPVARGG